MTDVHDNAFAELVRRHHDDVMRQALAVLRDFHRAQDVTQETFLEALLSLHRLKEPAAVGAWLRSIARHRCHRVLRSRDLELIPPQLKDQWNTDIDPPPRHAERGEDRRAVIELLRTLPRDERDAATLFYVRQCSQREAAAFLGVPVSTLNNRLHSARSLLKERMTNMLPQMNHQADRNDPFPANVGRIIDVRGPIVDASFEHHTPDVFDALAVADAHAKAVERMKVAQRLGNGVVRCIATGALDDLHPGVSVMNTGEVGIGLTPWIGVTPVADSDLERAVKMLATPQPTTTRILETGIKPIDLFCPLVEGGTVALLGIQGVGRIVLAEELVHRLAEHPLGLRIFYLVEPNEPDSVRGMLTKEKEYPGDVVGSVQTLWLLTDQAVEPDTVAAMNLFDAAVYCTPLLGIEGLFPAVDPVTSRSRLLDARVVGSEHVAMAERARDVLRRARELMTDPVLLEHLACRSRKKAWQRAREFPHKRLAELSPDDRLLVSRARKLQRFLTTPFFVAEQFNRRSGKFVSLAETIRGCREILDGRHDATGEDAFAFIGSIEEIKAA